MPSRSSRQSQCLPARRPPPVPVTAFGKFFITEPIDKNEGTIWVELTDIVEPGTSDARGIVQDVIKLFR